MVVEVWGRLYNAWKQPTVSPVAVAFLIGFVGIVVLAIRFGAAEDAIPVRYGGWMVLGLAAALIVVGWSPIFRRWVSKYYQDAEARQDFVFQILRVLFVFRFLGVFLNVLAVILSAIDALLVKWIAPLAGATQKSIKHRYTQLLTLLSVLIVIAMFVTIPVVASAAIGLGLLAVIAIVRRWQWVEHDRDLFTQLAEHANIGRTAAANSASSPYRILDPLGLKTEDLRDEALTSMVALFVLLALALDQFNFHVGAFGYVPTALAANPEACASSAGGIPGIRVWHWILFIGGELAKAAPFVDWSEVYHVENASPIRPICDNPVPAQHATFVIRAVFDLFLIAVFAQGLQTIARLSSQRDLFLHSRLIDRLDPFSEVDDIKQLKAEEFSTFPQYNPDRLKELFSQDQDYDLQYRALALLLIQGGISPMGGLATGEMRHTDLEAASDTDASNKNGAPNEEQIRGVADLFHSPRSLKPIVRMLEDGKSKFARQQAARILRYARYGENELKRLVAICKKETDSDTKSVIIGVLGSYSSVDVVPFLNELAAKKDPKSLLAMARIVSIQSIREQLDDLEGYRDRLLDAAQCHDGTIDAREWFPGFIEVYEQGSDNNRKRLRDLIKSNCHGEVRATALDTLLAGRPLLTIDELWSLVDGDDIQVQYAALMRIAVFVASGRAEKNEFTDEYINTVEKLIVAIEGGDRKGKRRGEVQQMLCRALVYLNPPEEHLTRICKAFENVSNQPIDNGHSAKDRLAIWLARETDRPEPLKHLCEALNRKESLILDTIANTLASDKSAPVVAGRQKSKVVSALTLMLAAKWPVDRMAAARALHSLGDPQAEGKFRFRLRVEQSETVKSVLIDFLGRNNQGPQTDFLIDQLSWKSTGLYAGALMKASIGEKKEKITNRIRKKIKQYRCSMGANVEGLIESIKIQDEKEAVNILSEELKCINSYRNPEGKEALFNASIKMKDKLDSDFVKRLQSRVKMEVSAGCHWRCRKVAMKIMRAFPHSDFLPILKDVEREDGLLELKFIAKNVRSNIEAAVKNGSDGIDKINAPTGTAPDLYARKPVIVRQT